MSKKSFVIYKDSLEILDELTDEQAAGLFRAIKNYQFGEEEELDPLVKIVFIPFRNQFIRDDEKYTEICAIRSESGSKGGIAKASKSKQELANGGKSKQDLANLADKEIDSESYKDSETVKKKRKRAFAPPSLEEATAFFKEKGYSTFAATKAWNHYSIADWHDAHGKPVKNWKQKMQSVWFKPENKVNEGTENPQLIEGYDANKHNSHRHLKAIVDGKWEYKLLMMA